MKNKGTGWVPKGLRKKLVVMGTDRNSYSKTDPHAAFMRMKEDRMRNGQRKPGYNKLSISYA